MVEGIRQAENLKIRTYWSMGRHINRYLSDRSARAGSIGQFYTQLSKDLEVNDRTLQHCEQFYRYFPVLKIEKGLSWSHYRFLLVVPDAQKRKTWIQKTIKNRWTTIELRNELSRTICPASSTKLSHRLPKSSRGKLYTYGLISNKKHGAGFSWLVDCGFKNRIEAPRSNGTLHNKRLYTSEKTENGYHLKVVQAVVDDLYTFKARLIRVVDADTLLVLVDQGFGIWTEQRLRLVGIDAPELSTFKGREAKSWVERRLMKLPFIIVKTYKSDKYDRYLADVFYLKGEDDVFEAAVSGHWLNQELIDRKLAVPYNKQ